MSRPDAIRYVSITEQTYYRRRKQYSGMGTDQLKELKKLQKENEQLRRATAACISSRSVTLYSLALRFRFSVLYQ